MTPAIALSFLAGPGPRRARRPHEGPGHCDPAGLPHVDGYRLLRRLGAGRLATVYLAHDRAGNSVALKVLRRDLAASRAQRLAFWQEYELAAAIRSAHVIRVLDRIDRDWVAAIAMEYLGRGDLGALLSAPVAPAVALPLLRQAALGLDALHSRGLAHGDVKPANLLLRDCGELVLADFGTAQRFDAPRTPVPAGLVLGTPRYAAPEQTRDGAASAAADVYSLGVVAYELLCGQPPFPGATLLEVSAQHVMAPVPRLPAALGRFQPLLDAMLAKQADRRLPDGRAVLAQIDLSMGAAVAHPAPSGATASRHQR